MPHALLLRVSRPGGDQPGATASSSPNPLFMAACTPGRPAAARDLPSLHAWRQDGSSHAGEAATPWIGERLFWSPGRRCFAGAAS